MDRRAIDDESGGNGKMSAAGGGLSPLRLQPMMQPASTARGPDAGSLRIAADTNASSSGLPVHLFDALDTDGNGVISREEWELARLAHKLGPTAAPALTPPPLPSATASRHQYTHPSPNTVSARSSSWAP
jgi:hypothetical protein